MNGKLYRWNPTPDYTLGLMAFGDLRVHTLERPWIEGAATGGKPFESCVPYGVYDLEPFARPNQRPDRTNVYMLVNESLGVYRFKEHVPESGGRYLILIHVGNFVSDIVGCIAPGITQPTKNAEEALVGSSGAACKQIFAALDQHEHNTLEILPLAV